MIEIISPKSLSCWEEETQWISCLTPTCDPILARREHKGTLQEQDRAGTNGFRINKLGMEVTRLEPWTSQTNRL